MLKYSSLVFCLVFLLPSGVFAQGTISTIAGGTTVLNNIPATQARLNALNALAVDAQGNAYIGESDRVRRVDARTGIISTVVASTGARNLAFDAVGRLVIAGSDSQLLQYDPTSGALTTIAPASTGSNSQFGIMAGMATDPSGNILITDDYNGKIYKVDATTNAVTTIAGIGMVAYTGSPQGDGGPATAAGLGRPGAITVDRSGNIFFAEQYWLRRIDGKTGIITTIARQGNGGAASGDGGPWGNAVFGNIASLTTDTAGNLFVGDWPHLREINWTTGIVSTIAGAGKQAYAGDGVPALQANIGFLSAIQVDAQGNLWLADNSDDRVLLIPASTGLTETIAGTAANGDGGPAVTALIPYATGLAATPQGDLYFMSGGLRRIDHTTDFISTIAFGQGAPTLGNGASPLAIDAAGDIYLSEQNSVQRVDAVSGAVTTVAGGYNSSLGDGGPATQAQITPYGAAIDSGGNVFIADAGNQRIRRVDASTGIITTVAGNGQGQAFSGLTGHATDIAIGPPTSIAIAPDGDIYWTTYGWVLRMNAAGDLSIAAGEGGGCVYAGDGGLAVAAVLCAPIALAFDDSGDLFITDNSRIRRVDSQSGIIQTVAGTDTSDMAAGAGSQDGIAATSAGMAPGAIAFAGGSLYLVDRGAPPETSARIRVVNPPVSPPLPQPPNVTLVADVVKYAPNLSPGAVVVLYGNYLWSQASQPGQTGADGLITSSLAGTQVLFNGIPSPLLYFSAGQINAVVPYGVKTSGTATVQVLNANGSATYSGALSLSPTSLQLYGNIIFNPDGTINSAAHPAPKSATLVLYGTGIGKLNPAVSDGTIMQSLPFPMPVAAFAATVSSGGASYPATIAYLGPLPEFVAGAVQANIQIPDNVPAGQSNLRISASGSNSGTTLPVYMFSDPPVLSSVSPASPISQSVGLGTYLTLAGAGLTGVTTFHFTLNGQPADIQPQQYQTCTSTSCTVFVNFAGQSGSFGVTVTNPSGQASNQATFTAQPYSPPTVTAVMSYVGNGQITASKGTQFVDVSGTNFVAPDTVTLSRDGAVVATLSTGNLLQAMIANPQLLQLDVDFQGIAGQYALTVSGTNGTSNQFAFSVNAP